MASTSDRELAREIVSRHEGVEFAEALRFATKLNEMRELNESRAAAGMDPVIEWDPKGPSWQDDELRRFFDPGGNDARGHGEDSRPPASSCPDAGTDGVDDEAFGRVLLGAPGHEKRMEALRRMLNE